MSPRSIQYIRSVLRIALNKAGTLSIIMRNPFVATQPVRVFRFEVRPLAPEQARTLLRVAEGDRDEPLYRVALALGLRLGEGLGLRWEDVDLDTGTLRVRFALQRTDGTLRLKAPKSEKSRRTLTMPASLVAALHTHRVRQLEERLATGDRWKEAGFIFPNTSGKPSEPSNVLKRFKRLLVVGGLPAQRVHDLRHCAASLLLAQGIPPRVVMDMIGHSQNPDHARPLQPRHAGGPPRGGGANGPDPSDRWVMSPAGCGHICGQQHDAGRRLRSRRPSILA